MKKREVPQAAIERNKAWIKAVSESLGKQNDKKLSRCIMKAAGKECAIQMHEIIHGHLEKKPQSVEEMVKAINIRRKEVLKADTFWELKDNKAAFRLNECGCDIVQAGLATPNPTFCLCSAGVFENLFAPYHNGNVRAEIEKSIGNGDKYCQFTVYFE